MNDFAHLDGAIEFLRSKPQNPFCLYLPIGFPHCPYFAPGKWHDLINPNDLPPLRPANLPHKPTFHDLIRQTRRLDQLGDDVFRKINAVYLGMIGVVDEMLGQLMDALEESGHADDTTIIFFSDHGDWAGDFGLVEKWPSALDDTLTRVPLVVRMPRGKAGHVVEEPNEVFDIMSTGLELAEIPARHAHFARSLGPQLHGAAGDPDRAVFADGGYARHEPHCFEGRQGTDQGIRSSDHIYYPKGQLHRITPKACAARR